jgi:hypothetical protein
VFIERLLESDESGDIPTECDDIRADDSREFDNDITSEHDQRADDYREFEDDISSERDQRAYDGCRLLHS